MTTTAREKSEFFWCCCACGVKICVLVHLSTFLCVFLACSCAYSGKGRSHGKKGGDDDDGGAKGGKGYVDRACIVCFCSDMEAACVVTSCDSTFSNFCSHFCVYINFIEEKAARAALEARKEATARASPQKCVQLSLDDLIIAHLLTLFLQFTAGLGQRRERKLFRQGRVRKRKRERRVRKRKRERRVRERKRERIWYVCC